MFQNVTITTYNKIVINYDTYELTPSNNKNIVIDNPWYIDTSSAPNFVQTKQSEINDMKLSIPEDVYSISDYQTYMWNFDTAETIPSKIKTFSSSGTNHETMVTNFLKQFNAGTITSHEYFINFEFNNHLCTAYPPGFTPTQEQSILCPTTTTYGNALYSNQIFPLVKTITLTLDLNTYCETVPEHVVYWKTVNYGSGEYTVSAGTYTYKDYINLFLQNFGKYSNPSGSYLYKYEYFHQSRFGSYDQNCWYGSGVESLFGKLHCYPPHKYTSEHTSLYSANNRCMTISSGDWNIEDFINTVNTSSHGFSITSDNHYIYINYPTPFIINPVCNIVDDVTDVSETFATRKILCAHPQYKQVNCTVTLDDNNYVCNERLTPAEFLLWIYNNTGVKCNIENNVITYSGNLSVSENPFFEFKENGTVVNKCNLSQLNITNYVNNKFVNYKTEYIYDSVNITYPVNNTNNLQNIIQQVSFNIDTTSNNNFMNDENYSYSEQITTDTYLFQMNLELVKDIVNNIGYYEIQNNKPSNIPSCKLPANLLSNIDNVELTWYNHNVNKYYGFNFVLDTYDMNDNKISSNVYIKGKLNIIGI